MEDRVEDGELSKATDTQFIVSKEKYKSQNMPFMSYFGVFLNDPSVCLVWFCSFNQYF